MHRGRKLAGLLLLFVMVFGLQTLAVAQAGTSRILGHAELKALVDSDLRDFLLVDARNPEEYREAHIPGAINIPQKSMDRFVGMLPSEKATRIIYYCNGVKCGKSKKSALKTMELGYTDVWIYAEGMPVWEEMGYAFFKGDEFEKKIETTKISPQDLNSIMAADPGSVTVVDVRDPEEFAAGHIPGAINLPLQNFAANSGVLDKKKTIVVYCNSGGRSYNAYKKLMKLGYRDINQAIFADWKTLGLKVEI